MEDKHRRESVEKAFRNIHPDLAKEMVEKETAKAKQAKKGKTSEDPKQADPSVSVEVKTKK